jgi:hypothetical protein
MKRLIFILAGVCVTMMLGGILGYRKGKSEAAIENYDTYRADLISYYGFPEHRKIQLKDFLKARYYYFANRVPSTYLESPYDYGNVDFQGLTIGKGPTTPRREYQVFKEMKVFFKEPGLGNDERANPENTHGVPRKGE